MQRPAAAAGPLAPGRAPRAQSPVTQVATRSTGMEGVLRGLRLLELALISNFDVRARTENVGDALGTVSRELDEVVARAKRSLDEDPGATLEQRKRRDALSESRNRLLSLAKANFGEGAAKR